LDITNEFVNRRHHLIVMMVEKEL